MLKTFDVILDIEKELHSIVMPAFNISQSDLNSIQVTFLIMQDENAFDLTDKAIRLAVKKPSGLTVYQDCTIIDAAAGEAQIILPLQSYIEYGLYTGEIMISDIDTTVITTPFYYTVRTAIMNEATEESSNDWGAFEEALLNMDKKPLIYDGIPTEPAEYIGQTAIDTTGKRAFIAYDLTAEGWQLIASAGDGGGLVYWNDILGKPTTEELIGPIGPAGPQGPAGANGAAGPIGPIGPQGPQGDTGAAGVAGPAGPVGPIGAAGPAGPVGPIGPIGPTGAAGPIGPKGDTGAAGPVGPIGPTGAQGPQGIQGPEGPEGPIGPQGDKGADGTGVTILGSYATEAELNAAHLTGNINGDGYIVAGDLFVWNGTAFENVGRIQGPIGPAGPTGAQGPQGPQGPIGPIGEIGPIGPTGDTGAAGPAGPAGPQGDIGPIGPQGDIGPAGPIGPIGPQGPIGDTGPQGPQGDTGPIGPIGPTGADGPQGDTGPQGPQGPIGLTGPQGDIGPAGDIGPTGPAGPAGPQGDIGPIGPQGDIGPAGPIGLTGPQGDIGPIGPAGPKGDTGATGAAGATGPAGPIGPIGPQGPKGDTGATGPAGPTGTVSYDSPAFTGTPTAPTAPTATNTTQIATTAFVQGQGFLKTVPLASGAAVGGVQVGNGLGMSGNYLYVKQGASLGIDPINYSLQVQTSNATPAPLKFWIGLQTDYDNITTKDANTLYFING